MDIQLPEIIFQIINFGVVVVALTYLLYKPVKKMLDERSAKVAEGQEAAELNIAEKHQIEEMKKKALKETEKAAAKVMAETRQLAENMEKDILKEAKEKAKAEVQKQQQEWEALRMASMKKLRVDFANEVVNMTAQVVGHSLDSKMINKEIDQNIDAIIQRL